MISCRMFVWAVLLPAFAVSSTGCSGCHRIEPRGAKSADDLMDELSGQLGMNANQLPTLPGLGAGGEDSSEAQADRYFQAGATPLAARLAAHALLLDRGSAAAAAARRDLLERRSWAWAYRGSFSAGQIPSTEGQQAGALFRAQGYECQDSPEDAAEFEHFHFAFFLDNGGKYLGSYAIASTILLGGERVYYVKRVIGGRAEILDVLDSMPSYSQVSDDVKARLEGRN